MNRTRVKICGITNAEDAQNAVSAGADALGFIFFRDSKRYIEPELASEITASLPVFVTKVGMFSDEPLEGVERVLSMVQLDILQFHGYESRAACEAPGLPYMKVLHATSHDELSETAQEYETTRAFLVDTVADGALGGTGQVFDWSMIPALDKPLVLAGGLNPENVGDAIRQVGPYGVDVCGGVEKVKRLKDMEKMLAFTKAVAEADRSTS